MPLTVTAAPDLPDGVEVVGIPVAEGPTVLGDGHGVEAGQLRARGFEAKVGETVTLPGGGDATVVAVGVGPASDVGPDVLRRAAAALVRAAWKRGSGATTVLAAVPD
ncbi:MAG: hypothetical protein M3N11_00835, partial [Actinomycetota bacterium]|nr:hypothetical protein [Actinomycetota bacterium]